MQQTIMEANMKLNPIKANMTELQINDKLILFSYKTPVACHIDQKGYFQTEDYYSPTTTKHINLWLKQQGFTKEDLYQVTMIPQEVLNNLLK
jgi:hypothetical protein